MRNVGSVSEPAIRLSIEVLVTPILCTISLLFDTNSFGYPDSVKQSQKQYMQGIIKEFENREPNLLRQKQLKIYLKELDRRRGTDFTKIYADNIANWVKDL